MDSSTDADRPLIVSLDAHTRDGPADHQLLDLGSALEDGVDLRITVPTLNWVLTGVAVATEDLYRILGNAL